MNAREDRSRMQPPSQASGSGAGAKTYRNPQDLVQAVERRDTPRVRKLLAEGARGDEYVHDVRLPLYMPSKGRCLHSQLSASTSVGSFISRLYLSHRAVGSYTRVWSLFPFCSVLQGTRLLCMQLSSAIAAAQKSWNCYCRPALRRMCGRRRVIPAPIIDGPARQMPAHTEPSALHGNIPSPKVFLPSPCLVVCCRSSPGFQSLIRGLERNNLSPHRAV